MRAFRITSYNVCYTKLLRVGYARKRGEALPSHVNFPKIDLIARAGFDQLWRPDVDVADIMGLLASKISPLLK